MSGKFVEGRKERIGLMLNWSKIETKDMIGFFEQRIAENPKDNTKEFFNQAVWVNKSKFLGRFEKATGVRPKLAENDYFVVLLNCEDVTEKMCDSERFRNCEIVSEYLQNHKFNGD